MTAPRAAATLASASASAEGDSSQPVSNASPPFSLVGSAANGIPGFAHAVLRRFDLRTLAIAAMALAGLVIIGLGLMVGQIWDTPLAVKLLRLVETAVAGVFIFVAVVAADEAVDRGTPRVTTYAIAVIVASVIGTTLGSEVRQLLKASFRPPGAGSGQHAVSAFEQGAVDYVMKPFSAVRLATAIARVRERLDAAPAHIDGMLKTLGERAEKRAYLRWVNAAHGQNVRLITTDEICYFKADNKYTLVVTTESEALIRKPIKELLDELDPEVFWPIHRGVVVNVNAIALAHRKLSGQFEIRLKTRKETLAVSEPFAYRFRQM